MKKILLLSTSILGSLATESMGMDYDNKTVTFHTSNTLKSINTLNSNKQHLIPILSTTQGNYGIGLDWERIDYISSSLETFNSENVEESQKILINASLFLVHCISSIDQLVQLYTAKEESRNNFLEKCGMKIQLAEKEQPKTSDLFQIKNTTNSESEKIINTIKNSLIVIVTSLKI